MPKAVHLQSSRWGKLKQLSSTEAVGASTSIPNDSDYTFMTSVHAWNFLVDSGSVVSVIPRGRANQKRKPTLYKLFAANATAIHTYGQQTLTVDLGLRRVFNWDFVVADVKIHIIGADFLAHFGLLIDLKARKLLDQQTTLTTEGEVRATSTFSISAIDSSTSTPEQCVQLLKQYIEITKPTTQLHTASNVEHTITTKGQPVSERPRKLSGEKLKLAKVEFNRILEQKIIRPSKSPWASPLHMEKKKNGEYRPCGDYRKINAQTMPDRYLPPLIQDLFEMLFGEKIFSTIDLRKAFNQIPMAEDIKKTAIITPFGLFELVMMTFGLRGAMKTMQRYLDSIFWDLDFVFCYIDDIFVMSNSQEEHLKHVRIVFDRLKEHSLTINLDECAFGQTEVTFLGCGINEKGYNPPQDRVEKVRNWAKPEAINDLRRFLGTINYYRKLIPRAAEMQALLSDYMKESKKNDKKKSIEPETQKKLSKDASTAWLILQLLPFSHQKHH